MADDTDTGKDRPVGYVYDEYLKYVELHKSELKSGDWIYVQRSGQALRFASERDAYADTHCKGGQLYMYKSDDDYLQSYPAIPEWFGRQHLYSVVKTDEFPVQGHYYRRFAMNGHFDDVYFPHCMLHVHDSMSGSLHSEIVKADELYPDNRLFKSVYVKQSTIDLLSRFARLQHKCDAILATLYQDPTPNDESSNTNPG